MLEWLAVTLVLVLLLGFWQTQIVHGARYSELAEANRLREARIRSPRGLILDRHAEILATNVPAYEVAIVREGVTDLDATLRWVAGVVDEPLAVLQERLDRQRGLPSFRPIVIASEVSQAQVAQIEARRLEHEGVVVQINSQRFYPHGASAAHVLGHVGEISPRQLEGWGDPFRMGDIVGQLGVEAVYNRELVGSPGSRLAAVNNAGREMRTLDERAPDPGQTVILTIDGALQREVEALLDGRRGAVVALDVATGGVLAMASSPAFDPNAFARRFSLAEWEALLADPSRPLQNRALQASLPPGSIFKLVMAAAGLEERVISTQTTYFCPGGKNLYGRYFNCLGQHGEISVVEAIARSCNSFFYELGVKLGRERIVKWAQRFGLGDFTGVDLPDEHPGIVPSDEWLAATGLRYYPGETVSVSIGQGRLAVSPLQLAHLAAIIGSGFVRQPHLLLEVEASSLTNSAMGRRYATPTAPAAFGESTRNVLLRGMSGSVAYGTSRRAQLPGIDLGAKTGTAQVASAENVAAEEADRPEHLRDHAWFVAVAPIDNPEIAIAVYLEHGGSGGVNAAPVGGQVLARHFGVPPEQVGFRRFQIEDEPTPETDTEAREGQR